MCAGTAVRVRSRFPLIWLRVPVQASLDVVYVRAPEPIYDARSACTMSRTKCFFMYQLGQTYFTLLLLHEDVMYTAVPVIIPFRTYRIITLE